MTWCLFAIAVLLTAAIVWVPGYLFLRIFSVGRQSSVLIAPIVSVAAYQAAVIVYAELGVFSSFVTVVIPITALFGLVAIVANIVRKQKGSACLDLMPHIKWRIPTAYVLIAAVIVLAYFVAPLNGPSSFCQEPDNATHLALVQSFMDSGNYSSLHASLYHSISSAFESPTGSESAAFYPSAWHCIAALCGSLLGCHAPIVANAALLVFLVGVIPLGYCALMQVLFPQKPLLIFCGSVACLAMGAFPWGFMTFGPLYSNLAAFSFVPAGLALVVSLNQERKSKGRIALTVLLLVLALFDLVLLQTNAVFTLALIAAPFVASAIAYAAGQGAHHPAAKVLFQVLACVAFLLVCAALWVFMYNTSFIQAIAHYSWTSFTSWKRELLNIVLLSYRESAIQPIAGVLVMAGIAYLLKAKKQRWLIVAYGLTCFLCMVAAVCDGEVRSFFIGFWYADSYRIAAMAAMAAVPLLACGCYMFIRFCLHVVGELHVISAKAQGLISCVSVFLLALCFFCPSITLPGMEKIDTPMGEFEGKWFTLNNNTGKSVLDSDEQAFLEEVSDLVGNDALILNKPDDGSFFAYGAYGANVYYKRTGIEGYNTDSEASKLIRLHLNEYATNAQVQTAVQDSGAEYVLLLDVGEEDKPGSRYWYEHYYPDRWVGMDAITDATPGFELLLSEGDMRLYRIESVV